MSTAAAGHASTAPRTPIPPSPAFEAIARGAPFRDRIAVPVRAPAEAIFDALWLVALPDMKLTWLLGEIRYLPARLAGTHPAGDAGRPFLALLLDGGTLVLRDDAPRELILGSAGRLHRVNQTVRRFPNRAAFDAFGDPDYEKLFMSVRVTPTGRPGEHWLVLEHATLPLSTAAERRFRRYWRVIKPAGAFMSRRLLRAVVAAARGKVQPLPRPPRAAPVRDELLDRYMPEYDVVERHHVRVAAPAEVTLAAAREMDLQGVPLIRAIFRARELLLGSRATPRRGPRGLLAEMRSLGWGVLAEAPGREVVLGAIAKPWEADVTFRSLPPDAFATFREPGFVKIAWTLRADPTGPVGSIFRTETRAVGTDADARVRFRRYWLLVSPGVALIRRLSLRPLRREAERRARAGWPHGDPPPAAGGSPRLRHRLARAATK